MKCMEHRRLLRGDLESQPSGRESGTLATASPAPAVFLYPADACRGREGGSHPPALSSKEVYQSGPGFLETHLPTTEAQRASSL